MVYLHNSRDDEEEMFYVVCMVVFAVALEMENPPLTIADEPVVALNVQRECYLARLYNGSDRNCHNELIMYKAAFATLCESLVAKGLCDSKYVKVEEKVAMFLSVIGHDTKNKHVAFDFIRSGETVSRCFNEVLDTVIKLRVDLLKPPNRKSSPSDCSRPRAWHHFFEDVVGALDGTYIHASVLSEDQPRFRNRKGDIRQNVLDVCSFDMKFTYVLAGWEGSAHDGRVLNSDVRHPTDPLTVLAGKYYLGDAGYPNASGFLTPYRGTCYHLKDHQGRRLENARELYNYRHSSLRNVIERCFGLLKKRFVCLRTFTFFPYKTQVKLVIACCIIHNFIREVNPEDLFEDEPDLHDDSDNEVNLIEQIMNLLPTPEWIAKRDQLVESMWNAYNPNNPRDH